MCEHKYVLLETIKDCENPRNGYNKSWKRTDLFFCEKCLNYESKVKTACEINKPEWY